MRSLTYNVFKFAIRFVRTVSRTHTNAFLLDVKNSEYIARMPVGALLTYKNISFIELCNKNNYNNISH